MLQQAAAATVAAVALAVTASVKTAEAQLLSLVSSSDHLATAAA